MPIGYGRTQTEIWKYELPPSNDTESLDEGWVVRGGGGGKDPQVSLVS